MKPTKNISNLPPAKEKKKALSPTPVSPLSPQSPQNDPSLPANRDLLVFPEDPTQHSDTEVTLSAETASPAVPKGRKIRRGSYSIIKQQFKQTPETKESESASIVPSAAARKALIRRSPKVDSSADADSQTSTSTESTKSSKESKSEPAVHQVGASALLEDSESESETLSSDSETLIDEDRTAATKRKASPPQPAGKKRLRLSESDEEDAIEPPQSPQSTDYVAELCKRATSKEFSRSSVTVEFRGEKMQFNRRDIVFLKWAGKFWHHVRVLAVHDSLPLLRFDDSFSDPFSLHCSSICDATV